MFTLKFYSDSGARTRIESADSLTILRGQGGGGDAEITLHQRIGEDFRVDISGDEEQPGWPSRYQRVIIENANGKTTEIIDAAPTHHKAMPPNPAEQLKQYAA